MCGASLAQTRNKRHLVLRVERSVHGFHRSSSSYRIQSRGWSTRGTHYSEYVPLPRHQSHKLTLRSFKRTLCHHFTGVPSQHRFRFREKESEQVVVVVVGEIVRIAG